MNLRDAAHYLGIGPRKFQYLVQDGHIRYVNDPGGKRMYPTAELDRFVQTQMTQQWADKPAPRAE